MNVHLAKQAARKLLRSVQKRNRNRLEIVLYHFVTAEQNPFLTAGHNVQPEQFEKQLEYLQSEYDILPLEEAPAAIRNGRFETRPAACVCFDDGYQSILTEAYPILQKLGIPATIFVCPSVLGNADLLWRDKIRYLIDRGLEEDFIVHLKGGETAKTYQFETLGQIPFYRWTKSREGISDMTIQSDLTRFFELKGIDAAAMAAEYEIFLDPGDVHPNWNGLNFGNHTWSHPLMTMLDRDGQRAEIVKTDEWLAERGTDTKMLAMPFSPFNHDTTSVLDELNYTSLYTVLAKSNFPVQNEAVLTLHRRLAPATLPEFRSLL